MLFNKICEKVFHFFGFVVLLLVPVGSFSFFNETPSKLSGTFFMGSLSKA